MRTVLLIALACILTGCLTPKAHENPKKADELRVILQDFHMKMRWGLWEQAAAYTAPSYRNEFLGRYEELGEDFKITNLEIKQVTLTEPATIVDVEQEWYQEPEMVVQKKRYIETWHSVNGNWLISERIPKDEWRKRQKESDEPAKDDTTDAVSSSSPSTSSSTSISPSPP